MPVYMCVYTYIYIYIYIISYKVQTTVRLGLKGCKIYHPRAPSWAIRYLVKLGNVGNKDSEGSTFL